MLKCHHAEIMWYICTYSYQYWHELCWSVVVYMLHERFLSMVALYELYHNLFWIAVWPLEFIDKTSAKFHKTWWARNKMDGICCCRKTSNNAAGQNVELFLPPQWLIISNNIPKNLITHQHNIYRLLKNYILGMLWNVWESWLLSLMV